MKKFVGIVAVIIALVAGIAALAAGHFKDPSFVKDLGLTPEQKQKLGDLRYQHRKDAITLRSEMELKRLDLMHEMDKDNPDPQVLDRLADEQGALRTKMAKARVHGILDMKKVLTPEQWAKAKSHFMEMRSERMGHRGQGRGAGPWGKGGSPEGNRDGRYKGSGGGSGQQGGGSPDGPEAEF